MVNLSHILIVLNKREKKRRDTIQFYTDGLKIENNMGFGIYSPDSFNTFKK